MKTIAALKAEHNTERFALDQRIQRAADYRATRSWYPLRCAHEVLAGIRTAASWIKRYPLSTCVYNKEFTPEEEKNWCSQSHHYRWIEDTVLAGLRTVGFADELANGIDHKGWYSSPDGFEEDIFRGIVLQLPAYNGFPRYVYGYADPNNDNAALIDFDIIEGPYGGEEGAMKYGDSGELLAAANHADDMARIWAEREKDYQAKDYAEQAAEEKRNEANDKHTALREYITEERDAIHTLREEADDLIENPWQLFA